MRSYTKVEFIDKLNNAAYNMNTFYKQGFVNYKGKTRDTKEYYTEILAQWCFDNKDLFNNIKMITRDESYFINSHDGKQSNVNSRRDEEITAKEIFKQNVLGMLGEIIDYQTPLKNEMTEEAGKIDLLSFDGKVLRVLELKREKSKTPETMIRCVLEGYTYFKICNWNKLKGDFASKVVIPVNSMVEVSPLVFLDEYQCKELREGRPVLEKLMREWKIKPYFIYKNERENFYRVVDDYRLTKCKLKQDS